VKSGRQDIAGEERQLGIDLCRQRQQRGVGQGHAHVLGLRAVQAVTAFDPAEQRALDAARGQPACAIEAAPAAHREGADDARAGAQAFDFGADRDDLADELVPQHRAAIEAGLVAAVDVQVRTAQTGDFDAHDRVACDYQLRLRDLGATHRAHSFEDQSLHRMRTSEHGVHEGRDDRYCLQEYEQHRGGQQQHDHRHQPPVGPVPQTAEEFEGRRAGHPDRSQELHVCFRRRAPR
jgi:hypothetical protein